MKHRLIILVLFYFLNVQYGIAQYTQVPDPNFEQALIDLGVDSEGILDGQFLTTDAIGVGTLNLDQKNIFDLTGIEAFVDLDQLFAADNIINSIDLTLLPSDLWTLNLSRNNLSSIDLSPISEVVNLYLNQNNFTEIDASNLTNVFILEVAKQSLNWLNLTNCTNLFFLTCFETSIETIDLTTCSNLNAFEGYDASFTSLDFSGNIEIEEIKVYNNPLTNINLPNNPDLGYLVLDDTLLTELDITHCPGLVEISFFNTPLNHINFSNNPLIEKIQGNKSSLATINVDNNPNLEWLILRNNNIEGSLSFYNNPNLDVVILDENLIQEVDFSSNPLLTIIDVDDNPNLEFVNIQNGANENIIGFSAHDCPNLSCVVVDDPNVANNNIFIDANTTLVGSVEECENLAINEEMLQLQISIYPNPAQDILNIESQQPIETVKIYNLQGQLIKEDSSSRIVVSSLSTGMYFVQVTIDGQSSTKQFIKE